MLVQHIPQPKRASYGHSHTNKPSSGSDRSRPLGIQKQKNRPPLIVQGDTRTDKRENTAKRMKVQKKYTPNKSMQCCGSSNGTVQVNVGSTHKRAFRTGMTTCKNPNCAYCATRMSKKRFDVMSSAIEGTNNLLFGTFTIPNSATMADSKGITKVWSRWWARVKRKNARNHPDMEIGYFRSIETTFQIARRNKFHTHIHFILGLKNSQSLPSLTSFGDELVSFWKEAVEKELGKIAVRAAQRIDVIEGAEGAAVRYMANPMKVLFELDGTTKTQKNVGGGISVWTLLDDIYLADSDDIEKNSVAHSRNIAIYKEFIAGMKGTRVLTSGGMYLNSKKAIEEECFEEEEDEEPDHIEVLHYDRHIHNALRSWNDTYVVKLVEDYHFRKLRAQEFNNFMALVKGLQPISHLSPYNTREHIHDHLKLYRIPRI